ncbi:hypothetical protein A3J19_03580 [Candidatus Daviesbacteria bacterium RIFCSPLOWO2_02_FULL_41_8]|uniref:Uncharacterized protein n=2 Tax=Candidatus Daviesiibacteriota TaxID=1752718 RepID=A0A1F5NHB3_9BACT|nr:MAG: hypothetical protein A3D83_04065 [Candidatus Daviesbacteria bacterium RIFCSPHIGHO2_02_FULL_41_10]OGE76983.1 MAG: hypothetical protein A3J19_03580 [Candidatus Daviesbacteria bacterium RIFCSPLOWO2_02_FULL_41_8]
MTKEEVRNILIQKLREILSDDTKGSTQIATLVDALREKIIQEGIPPHEHWKIHNLILEIINEWYRAGVIYFSKPDDPYVGYPFVTVTDFGKECLEQNNCLPYDPEGYIRELQRQNPLLDGVTLAYVRESISTYNSEHLLSSTITLGVASENLILALIDSFINAISDAARKQVLERRLENLVISRKYEEFRNELRTYERSLPRELTRDLDTYLDQVFHFIRMSRNSAGHPTGRAVSKNVAYSNLQIFAEYSKRICELTDYFSNHQI